MGEEIDDAVNREREEWSETDIENLDEIAKEIIIGYLIHYGYKQTAITLMRNDSPSHNNNQPTTDNAMFQNMDLRLQIYDLVMCGQTEKAIQQINVHFSSLFKEHEDVKFDLLCVQCIDLLKEKKVSEALQFLQQEMTALKLFSATTTTTTNATNATTMTTSTTSSSDQTVAVSNEAQMERLKDVLMLLCYTGAGKSDCESEVIPVSYLLDDSYRESVAKHVNSAILSLDSGTPQEPTIERILKQVVAVRQEVDDGSILSLDNLL